MGSLAQSKRQVRLLPGRWPDQGLPHPAGSPPRGVYRVTAAAEPPGSFKFQLFGNHWRFAEGDTIELEVGQRDLPFLRPDNLPSSISVRGVLSVPQAKT